MHASPHADPNAPLDCQHTDPDLRDLAELFVQDAPDRAAAIRDARAADDRDTLRTLAHQLKGSGGGYGYPLVTQHAAALEAAARDQDPDTTHAAVDTLLHTLTRLTVTPLDTRRVA